MQIEQHGRAWLSKKGTFWSIVIYDKLSDTLDTIPRPVKHVGKPTYIQTKWNKIKLNKSYLVDAVKWK